MRCIVRGCSSLRSRDRRWCPSHRPRIETGPRTLVQRIAAMLLSDPDLETSAIIERTGAIRQDVDRARRLVGVPAPLPADGELSAMLDRAILAARARADATVRHISPEAYA